MLRQTTYLLAVLMLGLALAETADAQIIDRVRQRVEREVERRVEDRIYRAALRAVDATEDAMVCLVTDPECIESARDADAELIIVADDGRVVSYENDPRAQPEASAPDAPRPPAARPGDDVWANYDFVPGNRALFVDDFVGDRVGNFPRRLTFAAGNMEVVEWEGQRLLRATAASAFQIPLPEVLPERFTIEFDVYSADGEYIAVMTEQPAYPLRYYMYPASHLVIRENSIGLTGDGPEVTTPTRTITEGLTPIRIAVDGSYIKAYANEQRVVNVPNANIPRSDHIHIIIWYARDDKPTFIGDIRVMAGGDDLYDRLMAEGRVVTQGILFDTGSAVIRPESTPTLKDIAAVLGQDPALRLRIEGHTDSLGSAEANQRLSEQRAQAVVDYLVQREGVAAERLEAAGMGQDHPIADNATAEGRQTNRRVEVAVLE